MALPKDRAAPCAVSQKWPISVKSCKSAFGALAARSFPIFRMPKPIDVYKRQFQYRRLEPHASPVRYFDVRNGNRYYPDLLLAAAFSFFLADDGNGSVVGAGSHHYVLHLVSKTAGRKDVYKRQE